MIGENSYQSLTDNILKPSQIELSRQENLANKSAVLAKQNEILPIPTIKFHQSKEIGTNALAFPGGPIVITDGLVELLDSDDLILAIIAHEMAHIQKRHTLQEIVNTLGATAIVSILFGADNSLYRNVIRDLNGLNSFEEAKAYLSTNIAEKFNWTHKSKRNKAKIFIKLVRRRYL